MYAVGTVVTGAYRTLFPHLPEECRQTNKSVRRHFFGYARKELPRQMEALTVQHFGRRSIGALSPSGT